MADLPDGVVALQRAAHAAWHELEAYRKQVTAARRAEAGVAPETVWPLPTLREWTSEAANRDLDFGYETVQGLQKAARATPTKE
jgi:hypothetical protein